MKKGNIANVGDNNVNDLMVKLGLGKVKDKLKSDIDDHVSYAVIELNSPKEQKAKLHTGSDDSIQVWLNGKSVQRVELNRAAANYQEKKDITLKQGKNILMVAIYEKGGGWSMFVGMEGKFTAAGKKYPQGGGDGNIDIAGDKITGPW